jgi:hypothetical protein
MASKIDRFPNTSACDVKAKSQPHFTLLAKDNFTPGLLREWIAMAEATGTPDAKINGARKILTDIEEYRRLHPLECKNPD